MLEPTCLPERAASRIEVTPDGCWRWGGFVDEQGYGRWSIRTSAGRCQMAHRSAYILIRGEVDDDLSLDHLCHTRDAACPGGPGCMHRRCMNPEHLEPVTHLVNVQRGRLSRPPACRRGHPLTDENVHVSSQGVRRCYTCKRVQDRAKAARHRAKLRAMTMIERAYEPKQIES